MKEKKKGENAKLRKMRKELYIRSCTNCRARSEKCGKGRALSICSRRTVIRARISFSEGNPDTAQNPIRIDEWERRGEGRGRGILLENCGRSGNIRAPLSPSPSSERERQKSESIPLPLLYARAESYTRAKLTRKEAI